MKYGRLSNGVLIYAPNPMLHNGMRIYNPSSAVCEAEGYLPIVNTEMPADGEAYYTSCWEEQDAQIVQVWTETELPAEEEVVLSPTTEERLAAVEAAILAIMGGVE